MLVTALVRFTPLLYGEVLPNRVLGPAAVVRFNGDRPGGALGFLALGVLSATGVLVPVLVAQRHRLHGHLAASLLFVVPNVAGILVATDWPRVIGPSIVVLAPAGAVVVPARRRWPVVALSTVVCWLAWRAAGALNEGAHLRGGGLLRAALEGWGRSPAFRSDAVAGGGDGVAADRVAVGAGVTDEAGVHQRAEVGGVAAVLGVVGLDRVASVRFSVAQEFFFESLVTPRPRTPRRRRAHRGSR
ncbi:MAG: hypothetical protein R2746_02505 [Acidimicrobiales bacterium]